jgi:hypothetical protein
MNNITTYTFKSKNGKEYRFELSGAINSRHLNQQSIASVHITSDPVGSAYIHGYIFPILKNKNGIYVKWWDGWFTQFWIPLDVRKRINKIVKLLIFT